ncbi:MAG: NPCBM/NEW2 domain-containing protein [Planctomycetes bacterium]|nr:NPCBM/NEW2 domain-containing protein [Planctomycetota bacterium]
MFRRHVVSLTALLALGSAAIAQEPKFQSKIVNESTPGMSIDIDVDVTGAKELYLVVRDGGDGFGCDWADWAEPRLISAAGEKKLTELKWKSAAAEWGQVGVNKNAGGDKLKIAGKPVEYGIGTHANSVIAYDLPVGTTRFKARGGIDNGGSDQAQSSSIQFLVYTQKPPVQVTQAAPAGGGSRDPKDAVSGLDVAEGLEATLFASEASHPAMLNPTSIDIDHLGRVWVCEVVNYRHRNGERKEGDRILILEDTNGDGVSDKQTVFHQGHDVDSAHGICVLPTPSGKGTRVIISCGDSVFFLHDEDGDLKSDGKQLLFTGIEGTQHDHGIHAFHFGPDGKLYFNFGNSGRRIKDKDGKQIVDLSGREVHDHRKPYQEGMVFRCNMDGSEFETLGWDFRNNWEIAVDSFGTLWQSDNDDDGNKGVRINYVMEFGNYGYRDEMTGAGWNSPRTNLEAVIPLRHWHLNDPGVVPNLLQTGAGSPTGICVYEGNLLPKVFHNQMIHCDAGPNVVRSYPAKKSGAGYSAEIVNILEGTRDNWFRPSDVCVAPDGSLIVADWYDPGVGGHRMGDADRGRLFRVAPPKAPYKFPAVDVSTVEGAVAALKSPNEVTRYVAWTALNGMGDKAEAALTKVFESDPNPRVRARALWLLGKLEGKGPLAVAKAIGDSNPDLRIAGLRLARELRGKLELTSVLQTLVNDPAVEVRRDCAIALNQYTSAKHAEFWATLAKQHDGKDRWYLEALGIGAYNNWDACIKAWQELKLTGNDAARRDIIWRSRAKESPALLVSVIQSDAVSAQDVPRYLRAFDFLSGPERDDALIPLAFGNFGDEAKTRFVNTEAISRLKGFDVTKNPEQLAALNRVLNGLKGDPQFVALIDKFSVVDRYPELVELASKHPDDQIGLDAIRVLLAKRQTSILEAALKSNRDQGRSALGTATALSNSGDGQVAALLLPVVKDPQAAGDLRRQSIKGATLTKAGAAEVLKLAESKQFDDSFIPALSAALQSGPLDETQRARVLAMFPAPAGKNEKPLPPLSELARLKGNPGQGAKLFGTVGKCNTCHVVNGEGKEVGPNLSEIGAKLARQAMFESIVFPSAGISHNYESWTIALANGTTATGILISEDDTKLSLRGNDALVRTFDKKDIEERVKNRISLMPADLAKLLTPEEMADIVEFLGTLKKAKK